MSSRRSNLSKAAQFKRLKELRLAGETRLYDVNSEEEADIYDEVTEEEYKAIAKRAMLEDDFVVDDTGQGYAENGLEDWDRPESDYGSSDEQLTSKHKQGSILSK